MSSKKVTAIIASVIIVIAIAAGIAVVTNQNNKKGVAEKTTSSNSKNQKETETKAPSANKPTDITSTLAAWKVANLIVSDEQSAYYQVIGADDGGKYDVGSTNVELYEFSDSTKADSAKTSYFTNNSDTVLVVGTLLIDIHSTNAAEVDPIKAVF